MTIRIAIAGMQTESSTFSLDRTDVSRFEQLRGQALLSVYDWSERLEQLVADVEWVPLLRAVAFPGGPVEPEAFDGFEAEIVAGLRDGGRLDGVFLDMHGAMFVRGRRGAEEQLLRSVRAAVGSDPVVSLAMDPHGNVSEELASLVDLTACYRHAPHIDVADTRDRAMRLLIETIRKGVKPLKAWVRIPVLLPGERTSTLVEPGKSVFGALEGTIEQFGALDANLWVGFAWADEPRCSAAVLVTGYDEESILECAQVIATSYWDARRDFAIVSDHHGSCDDALDFVETHPPVPCFISDSGDNITAGGSGDLTYALTATLNRDDTDKLGVTFMFAGMFDPRTVSLAVVTGVGNVMDAAVGATTDDRFAAPVQRSWTVDRIIDGHPMGSVIGAVLRSGPVSVAIQTKRAAFIQRDYTTPGLPNSEPTDIGLSWADIDGFDAVVVKNGYLFPDQAQHAGSWFLAVTPSGTDLDLSRLSFSQLEFPVFPFNDPFEFDPRPRLVESMMRPKA